MTLQPQFFFFFLNSDLVLRWDRGWKIRLKGECKMCEDRQRPLLWLWNSFSLFTGLSPEQMLEASVDPDPAITMQLLTACKMHSSVFYQVICLSLLVCIHFKLQYEGLSGVVLSTLWKRNKKRFRWVLQRQALTRPKVPSAMERQSRLPLHMHFLLHCCHDIQLLR